MRNSRRKFIALCVAGTAASAACAAAPTEAPDSSKPGAPAARKYARVKLVDADGKPVKAATLKPNFNYVFNYPYAATPCFLLNLDRPVPATVPLTTEAGMAYDWPGGVGRSRTIVAYSAICAHKLAYPTRQVSFIGFRGGPAGAGGRGNVITCCADKSIYDPFAGARVVSGPARQPLAAILLEHDVASDELYAVGTFGGEKFNEFFQKYEFKLSMELGGRAREAVTGSVQVVALDNYSMQTARC